MRWGIVSSIVVAWVITIPAGGGVLLARLAAGFTVLAARRWRARRAEVSPSPYAAPA